MTHAKSEYSHNGAHHWMLSKLLGVPIVARKRYRLGVYTVWDDTRTRMDICIRSSLRRRHQQLNKMTLENAYKPWWMSQKSYQAMLTRLGLPF